VFPFLSLFRLISGPEFLSRKMQHSKSSNQACAWDTPPSFVSPARIPPVIISYSEDKATFHNIGFEDLKVINQSILDQAGEPISSSVMKGGDLKIQPKDVAQQEKLLKITSVGGKPVTASLPKSATLVLGIIRGVPTDLPDDVLRLSLEDQGVAAIKRLKRMSGNSPVDTGNVTLAFKSLLPTRVKVSNLSFTVQPFYQSPYRCRKCQLLGHTISRCKSTSAPACPTCCKVHNAEEPCSQWCINCEKSDHLASSPQCGQYLFTKEALRMSATMGISVADAKEKLRALTNVTVAKQVQVASEDSGVVQQIREELESLKREMVDLKTTKLPDIVSSLSNLDNKTDRINDRVETLENNLDTRLEGFSSCQKDIKSTMEERFSSLTELIRNLASASSSNGPRSTSSTNERDPPVNANDDVQSDNAAPNTRNSKNSDVPPAQEGEAQSESQTSTTDQKKNKKSSSGSNPILPKGKTNRTRNGVA